MAWARLDENFEEKQNTSAKIIIYLLKLGVRIFRIITVLQYSLALNELQSCCCVQVVWLLECLEKYLVWSMLGKGLESWSGEIWFSRQLILLVKESKYPRLLPKPYSLLVDGWRLENIPIWSKFTDISILFIHFFQFWVLLQIQSLLWIGLLFSFE